MRYTPLSRFQGTVLGAAIGSVLGVNCRNRPGSATPKSWSDVTYWGFQPIANETLLNGSMTWGRVAVEHMRRLTQSPSVQNQPLQLIELPVQDSATRSQVASHDQDLEAGLAIATLPFALFYHEDLHLLRQQIHLIVSQKTVAQAHAPEAELGATVVHCAIALAVQNQLQPFQLIPQLLADLQLSQFHPALAEQLTQVQKSLVGQTAETLTDETLIPFHSRQLSFISLAFFAFFKYT